MTLGLAAIALPGPARPPVGPVFYLLCFFAAWIVVTNEWLNPSHTAAAAYHAAFLFGGYLLGIRWPASRLVRLYGVAMAGASALALWAIWQRTQGVSRPTAVFETPATLSAVLNMVFLPGVVLALLGRRRWLFLAALTVIAAALILAGSRGGWLGFGAGAVIAAM
ncbi:MAG TPA: hypothetical protein VEB41_14715, partial [Burkholderiales bacterium]|nr:hypothetical protein [Burkholderiales bacterium]